MRNLKAWAAILAALFFGAVAATLLTGCQPAKPRDEKATKDKPDMSLKNPVIKPGDWNQWGGTSLRNNTPVGSGIVTDWDPGEFDRKTGEWKPSSAKNIKWVAALGSQTYGNPV